MTKFEDYICTRPSGHLIFNFDSSSESLSLAKQRVKEGLCDGSCEKHKGVVALVENKHFGYFSYCENAVNEDHMRGCKFKVFY